MKLHSPRLAAASSLEEETTTSMLPVSGATGDALQDLLEKYGMDPKDTKLLLSFNNKAADCGNSVMNGGHFNDAPDVADVEAAASVLHQKGL
jgi:hypothetical protein